MAQSKKEVAARRNNPPHKSYKHIALVFIVLAVVLVLGVTYLALSKVTITLIPSDKSITYNFNATIAENPDMASSTNPVLAGKIISDTRQVEQQFSVKSGKTVDAQAEGTVTLYNKRSNVQTLVATTRLLSSNNVLFRLKDKVNIPPNSTLPAKVYADKKGASGNIGPTKFTIPGLSASLQKLVYAESTTAMTGGTRQIGILTTDDVEQAKDELIKNKSANILTPFIDNLDNKNLTLIDSQTSLSNLNNDKQLGEEVNAFTLSADLTLNAVFADKTSILEMAKSKLTEPHRTKGEFIKADPASLEYKLVQLDPEKKQATIKIKISGLTTLNPDKNMFDKDLLVGFTVDDLKLYFSQFESIKEIKVEFSPFWVKKVPILKDHIYIQVAK